MTISNVEHKCANCVYWGRSFYTTFDHCTLHEGSYGRDDCCDNFTKKEDRVVMNELIDKLSKTCDNCKYRETLTVNYPCCTCLEYELDNGKLTGGITLTKFSPIDAMCVPKHNDIIHRYLDKLKEEGLITGYDISTMYTDDKPFYTVISLYKGKREYSREFSDYDISDQNLVIEILAECVIKFYRTIANNLMEEIKEDKK